MKVLELFCGTKSFTKVAEARGHECRTLDNNPRFEPTYCMDIIDFKPEMLDGWHPDIVWASPPCTNFSVASISRNWRSSGPLRIPISEGAKRSQEVVCRVQEIIRSLQPRYYFIENPRGMLRKMSFMQGWNRSTVTYCQYGQRNQKPTDIWNNCLDWTPRPVCWPRSPCHDAAPRGAKTGTQGIHGKGYDEMARSPILRAVVPAQLCEEIIIACEKAIV